MVFLWLFTSALFVVAFGYFILLAFDIVLQHFREQHVMLSAYPDRTSTDLYAALHTATAEITAILGLGDD